MRKLFLFLFIVSLSVLPVFSQQDAVFTFTDFSGNIIANESIKVFRDNVLLGSFETNETGQIKLMVFQGVHIFKIERQFESADKSFLLSSGEGRDVRFNIGLDYHTFRYSQNLQTFLNAPLWFKISAPLIIALILFVLILLFVKGYKGMRRNRFNRISSLFLFFVYYISIFRTIFTPAKKEKKSKDENEYGKILRKRFNRS